MSKSGRCQAAGEHERREAGSSALHCASGRAQAGRQAAPAVGADLAILDGPGAVVGHRLCGHVGLAADAARGGGGGRQGAHQGLHRQAQRQQRAVSARGACMAHLTSQASLCATLVQRLQQQQQLMSSLHMLLQPAQLSGSATLLTPVCAERVRLTPCIGVRTHLQTDQPQAARLWRSPEAGPAQGPPPWCRHLFPIYTQPSLLLSSI